MTLIYQPYSTTPMDKTFTLIGEIPQKTERSCESKNGLNNRGVENDIYGLGLSVFLITLIVTLLIVALYSVYCIMLKRLKSRSKSTTRNGVII